LSASPWYDATPDAAGISPDVAERALEWVLELQGDPVSPAVVQAWVRWCAEHPDHELAWQRIESVRGKLRPLASPVHSAIAQATLTQPDSAHRRDAIKALAVLVFAGGAAWGVERYAPWPAWASDYRTAAGERRTMILPDGTQLVLNTDSAVDVRFQDDERRVKLIAGEVLVTTAVDRSPRPRPFLVESVHGTARALGTRYSVRQMEHDTEVSVFSGAVQIRPRRNMDHSVILQAGYRASYTTQTVMGREPVDETSIAWKDGFIVARSIRLDDFIAELGRYSSASLSCDPRIASLRVSGSFPVKDIASVMAALGTTLGMQTEIRTSFWGRKSMRLAPTPQAGIQDQTPG
jgi:transmembrane sensor